MHLLEIAKALYFRSNKVPASFGGECVLCAAYLINRMSLPTLNYITPYEKLFGVKPDNHQLKMFGCICYSSTLKPDRSKFDSRLIHVYS